MKVRNTLILALIICSSCSTLRQEIGSKQIRTALYFGLSIPSGGNVSEKQWQAFVDEEVTPRFQNGFTVIDGKGQWLDQQRNKIYHEDSKVLIILHQKNTAMEKKLDSIKQRYIELYNQQSVLRVDQKVRVWF